MIEEFRMIQVRDGSFTVAFVLVPSAEPQPTAIAVRVAIDSKAITSNRDVTTLRRKVTNAALNWRAGQTYSGKRAPKNGK